MCPENALDFAEFESPASAVEKKLVGRLITVYGAGGSLVGLFVHSAVYYRDCNTLGCHLIGASSVASLDGALCQNEGGSRVRLCKFIH